MTAKKIRPTMPPATPPAIPAVLDAEEGVVYELTTATIGIITPLVELSTAELVGVVGIEEVSPVGIGIERKGRESQ